MASFHGFKITKMQSWEGMEGLGTCGTLYWNRTKLGDFIDYGDGGCVNFRFPTGKLSEAIKAQLPHLSTDIYGKEANWMEPSLDTIVLHLADLTEREKLLRSAWRRANKRGGVVIAINANGNHYHFSTTQPATDAEIAELVNWFVNKHAIHGNYVYTVFDKLPTLEEGSCELVNDKDALKEIREFRKSINQIERIAKMRLGKTG